MSLDDVSENVLDRWQGRESVATEVLKRLESGEPADAVAAALDLGALDVISALAVAGLGTEGDEGPALRQQSPRRPALEDAAGEGALAKLLPGSSRTARLALAAGLLQILDFWDASHTAAQEADDLGERSFSAYWHGIAHRREPDAGNASYWFRRVGRHPSFAALGAAARRLIESEGDALLANRLCPKGGWDPFAMIDFCTQARRGSPGERLGRRIQRLEMLILLAATAEAAGAR